MSILYPFTLFWSVAMLLAGLIGSEEDPLPNIIVVLTDDQTFRAIGYVDSTVQTPFLDRLGENGVIFDQHYTASPICVASRASLMTGKFPQANGVVALDNKAFQRIVVDEHRFRTLPQRLNDAGYLTLFSGKSHLGDPTSYGFKIGKEWPEYHDRETFRYAAEILAENAGQQPYFLWLALRQPHLPLKPEQAWLDRYRDREIRLEPNFREFPQSESFFNQGLPGEHLYLNSDYLDNVDSLPAGPPRSEEVIRSFRKAYYATITHFDQQLNDLFSRLERQGLLRNTIIIFTSDNGYFLGNHGLGNKITMHEESVRVPLFIHGKGVTNPHRHYSGLTSSLDVTATILDLAGAPTDEVDGISLAPVLNRQKELERSYVASECIGIGGKVGEGHRMVRSGSWKYMVSGTGEEALFNLKEDPYELENRINVAPSAVIDEMRHYLQEWKKQVGYSATRFE